MEPCSLTDNAVHVWYILAPRKATSALAARHLNLLSPDERTRHDRFLQEKDRCQFLLGKVLVRTVLSYYLGGDPHAWVFTTNRFGKPILANSPEPMQFNLSHTEGLVACALARNFEVGIDVESIERSANMDIARRFFAPAEVAFLENTPEERRQAVFFQFWTLKEAYIKARGQGLSMPLEQFAFRLEEPPRVTFEPAMRDDPEAWRFLMPSVPSDTHQVAVAVQCPQTRELEIQTRSLAV
jgi:4'-phosphopantetheinyl transferase